MLKPEYSGKTRSVPWLLLPWLFPSPGHQLPRFYPDSKVHGANMGPIWGQQDPGGPHAGPMNFAIWVDMSISGPWIPRGRIQFRIAISISRSDNKCKGTRSFVHPILIREHFSMLLPLSHWNEKVVRVTALVFTWDVEAYFQRPQSAHDCLSIAWTEKSSGWLPWSSHGTLKASFHVHVKTNAVTLTTFRFVIPLRPR